MFHAAMDFVRPALLAGLIPAQQYPLQVMKQLRAGYGGGPMRSLPTESTFSALVDVNAYVPRIPEGVATFMKLLEGVGAVKHSHPT